MQKIAVTLVVAACASSAASARSNSTGGNLAAWTFESSVPSSAGPHIAESGLFAATSQAFAVTGGTISNPVGNGSLESLSSNGWDAGDYFEFRTSTLGYTGLTLSWDQVRSSTGPGVFDLVASVNGVDFATLVNDYAVRANDAPFWSSGGPRVQEDIQKLALSAAFDNQASVIFRLVAQVSAASTGTNRVDNVFLNGVEIPTPGSVALLAIAGVVTSRRRRD